MIKIPTNELNFKFSRSSGPGGQNVNKVYSRVTLSWDMKNSSSCSSAVKKRFLDKYPRLIVDEHVVIHSQKHRSQNQNITDCIEKLHKYLSSVEHAPKIRKATKPSKSAVNKRLDKKAKDSKIKKLRREKF